MAIAFHTPCLLRSIAARPFFFRHIAAPVTAVLMFCVSAGTVSAQWDPATQVSSDWRTFRTGIGASGKTVHLIWGSWPVRYRRSTDEGKTWSADIVLANGEPRLTDPLAVQGSNVYVTYLRDITTVKDWCCPRGVGNIYLRRSLDAGLSWKPEIKLTTAGGAFRISTTTAGSRVHLVWSDFRDNKWEIYYRRSLDGGDTWLSEVRLVTAGNSETNRPQIAAMGDDVHLVWVDDRDSNPACYTLPHCAEVYYKRSTDAGATWGPNVRLTSGIPFSGRPDVTVVAPGTVIVGYDEDRDHNLGHEQYVMVSTDGGGTWGDPVRLSSAPGLSTHNSLVAAGSTAHIAWHDDRGTGRPAIYYRFSLDRGATWEAEERVTFSTKASTTPLLALTAGYAHMIWLDDRTGSFQVWYRRRALAPDTAATGLRDSGAAAGSR